MPLGDGSAAQNEPYWLEKMKHQGLSAYNKDPPNYRTFRNVKDFGARGDGFTDDTQAILYVFSFPYLCLVVDGLHQSRNVDWGPLRNELRQFHHLSRHCVLPTRVCSFLRETRRAPHFPGDSTYLVSDTIQALYYTEIVGDARRPPTILAAANFNPTALAIFGKPIPAFGFKWSVTRTFRR